MFILKGPACFLTMNSSSLWLESYRFTFTLWFPTCLSGAQRSWPMKCVSHFLCQISSLSEYSQLMGLYHTPETCSRIRDGNISHLKHGVPFHEEKVTCLDSLLYALYLASNHIQYSLVIVWLLGTVVSNVWVCLLGDTHCLCKVWPGVLAVE